MRVRCVIFGSNLGKITLSLIKKQAGAGKFANDANLIILRRDLRIE